MVKSILVLIIKNNKKEGGEKNMDLVKKAMLIGLGMINLTREKAEEFVDELIKKGEVAKTEKFKMVDRLLKMANAQEKELMQKVSEMVRKTIAEMGLPTKEDMEKIMKKLEDIEKKISQGS